MAVRDFLNEGGKLINTAERRSTPARAHQLVGGPYYALNGDRTAECVITTDPGPVRRVPAPGRRLPPVLPGRVHRVSLSGPNASRDRPADRRTTPAWAPRQRNPLDEAGVFQPTSEVLPAGSSRSSAARAPRSSTSRATRSRRPRAPTTRGRSTRNVLHAADQDDRPVLGAAAASVATAVPALVQHGTVVRQRDRRGAYRGPR